MKYDLKPIDSLEIYVLMDNISDPFTKSHEGLRWNEFQFQFDLRKQEEMCGANMCRACNGLSLFIRVHVNSETHCILFDTGPDENLVVENAQRLGLNLAEVDAIVLSHGHFDHFGGTLSALKAIGKKQLPVYVHPELFLPRAFDRGELIKVSNNLTREEVEENGGKVIEHVRPMSLFYGAVMLTGEVPRVTPYETGAPSECRLKAGEWVKSPEIIDERCLIFNLKEKGLCIFTGCGHTGVVNATLHAKELVEASNIHIVMGGFHLAGPAFANRISPTVEDLLKIDPDYIVTGHCTGRQAQTALTNAFNDRHIPYAVGTVFKF